MGCILSLLLGKSKEEEQQPEVPKKYSWDLRKEKNVNDFKFENLDNAELFKGPGSINGEQFIIRNCSNSKIFLLDYTNMLTVDDSSNCLLILGPVKSSVFFRNCSNCTCVVACGQFRMRDCKKMNIFLHSATTPTIESSTDIEFACHQLNYNGLKEQFKLVNLNIFTNCWYSVHDFTPGEGSWGLLPPFCTLESLVSLINTSCNLRRNLENVCLDLSKSQSLVPQTIGAIIEKPTYESCLVLFILDSKTLKVQDDEVLSFIKKLTFESKDVSLINSRSVVVTLRQILDIFEGKTLKTDAESITVIGLHFHGLECLQYCNKVAFELSISPQTVLISASKTEASRQVEQFFSLSDMLVF
nr:PREDICTED: protein XRP2-like [Bemisia tabaci]